MSQAFQQAGHALIWRGLQHVTVKLIFLARLLILARLLSPDDFGLLAISAIFIDVLLQISNFGMVPALVQRAETEDKHYHVAWTVGVIRGVGIAGITALSAPLVANFFEEPRAAPIILALALRPLIDAVASIRTADLTRKLNFRSLAILEIPKALGNALIAILLARSLGVWALVAGALGGSLVYLLLSYLVAPYRPSLTLDFNAARGLVRFGQWVFVTSLVALAGQAVLRVVISRQLGTIELGLYYLAASLAFFPAEIASQIIGEVAFPFYARLQAEASRAAQAFRAILISTTVLLVPMVALLITLTPSLVATVLGSQWAGTTGLIRVLALASLVGLVGETIVPILNGIGHPDRVLVIEVIQTVFLIIFAALLARRYGVIGAAAAWLPAVGAAQLAAIVMLRRHLPTPFAGTGVPAVVLLGISITGAGIAGAFADWVPGWPGLAGALLAGLCFSAGLVWYTDRRFALGYTTGLSSAYPRLAARLGLPNSPAG